MSSGVLWKHGLELGIWQKKWISRSSGEISMSEGNSCTVKVITLVSCHTWLERDCSLQLYDTVLCWIFSCFTTVFLVLLVSLCTLHFISAYHDTCYILSDQCAKCNQNTVHLFIKWNTFLCIFTLQDLSISFVTLNQHLYLKIPFFVVTKLLLGGWLQYIIWEWWLNFLPNSKKETYIWESSVDVWNW